MPVTRQTLIVGKFEYALGKIKIATDLPINLNTREVYLFYAQAADPVLARLIGVEIMDKKDGTIRYMTAFQLV